jgi:hypothetical protein
MDSDGQRKPRLRYRVGAFFVLSCPDQSVAILRITGYDTGYLPEVFKLKTGYESTRR